MLRRGHSALAFAIAWIALCFLPTSGLAPLTHARAVRYLAPSVFGCVLGFDKSGNFHGYVQSKSRR